MVLVIVGLAGLIFMCSLMTWIGSSVTGYFSDAVAELRPAGGNSYSDYGAGERFPVILPADKTECLARRWQIVTVQLPNSIVYECWPK
jgi:hypothetical protein